MGLLPWARRTGDIDRLLHGRPAPSSKGAAAATASSVTFTAAVEGWTQTCSVLLCIYTVESVPWLVDAEPRRPAQNARRRTTTHCRLLAVRDGRSEDRSGSRRTDVRGGVNRVVGAGHWVQTQCINSHTWRNHAQHGTCGTRYVPSTLQNEGTKTIWSPPLRLIWLDVTLWWAQRLITDVQAKNLGQQCARNKTASSEAPSGSIYPLELMANFLDLLAGFKETGFKETAKRR